MTKEPGSRAERLRAVIVEMQERDPHVNITTQLLSETTQATTYVLGVDRKDSLVLKLFDPSYSSNDPSRVREEAETVSRFHKELEETHLAATAPNVRFVSHKQMAYVMTYFEGESLLRSQRIPYPHGHEQIVSTLLGAMRVFYETIGPLYGDFHAQNILRSESGTVCFIDPTHPNPAYRKYGQEPYEVGVGDLAYWISTACVASLRLGVLRPSWIIQNLRITARLTRAWVEEFGGTDMKRYEESVFDVCDEILRRMLLRPNKTRNQLILWGSKLPEFLISNSLIRSVLAGRRSTPIASESDR